MEDSHNDTEMQGDAQAPSQNVINPYQNSTTPYKDALLSSTTVNTNRLGVDTFKLLYLLNLQSATGENEDDSVHSDHTNTQTNLSTYGTFRMRFQITLTETTQETYMEDLATHVNKILDVININTPGVCLVPWHSSAAEKKDMITAITDDPLDAVKYLYGFKAGLSKSGVQYFRIHLAFPSHFTADDNSLMIPGKQSLLKANSQCINPVTIGWLLRSNPALVDFDDLGRVLKAIWRVQGGFGLYWATVKDGKPYDALNTTRAIHIEVEETQAVMLTQKAEQTYGRASKHLEDYPLGMNMMFVQPYGDVKGSAKALVTKLATYQHTNEKMLTYSSWFGEMALDRSISSDTFISLRNWLMNMTSITAKTTRDGQQYYDKLFTSIHRDTEAQEVRFYFYKANETEATNVVSALPLVIRDGLGLDPSCFLHKSDYAHILEGSWDHDNRVFKNRNMINQEQYLMDLDDCFMVNQPFLPNTVFLNPSTLDVHNSDKNMAMANGEDDVSILSTPTDKTLQAAVTRPGEHNGKNDDTSIQSGMTSKSKTQQAVKLALKEVSIEHQRAMSEQQQKFQKEIEELKRALTTGEISTTLVQLQQGTAVEGTNDMETESNNEELETLPPQSSLQSLSQLISSPTRKSPVSKRPKRSKSRNSRGRGPPNSTNEVDV
jgi:hypothetical protein